MSGAARPLAAALLGLLLACGRTPSETRIDLNAYLAHSKGWAPAEAEAARTIKRIFDTQFVNETEVLHQIADSRPRVLAHLAQLRAYTPRSKEVGHVHDRYVSAWQQLLDGYDAIEKGFASGDYTHLARGREALEAWRETIVDVARELRELMQHFGIDPGGAVASRSRPAGKAWVQRTYSSACPAAIA